MFWFDSRTQRLTKTGDIGELRHWQKLWGSLILQDLILLFWQLNWCHYNHVSIASAPVLWHTTNCCISPLLLSPIRPKTDTYITAYARISWKTANLEIKSICSYEGISSIRHRYSLDLNMYCLNFQRSKLPSTAGHYDSDYSSWTRYWNRSIQKLLASTSRKRTDRRKESRTSLVILRLSQQRNGPV